MLKSTANSYSKPGSGALAGKGNAS